MSTRVYETDDALAARKARAAKGKPDHWLTTDGNKPTEFHNPWPSFRSFTTASWLKYSKIQATSAPSIPSDINTRIATVKPTWGSGSSATGKIKATWLGHACFLVELPARSDTLSRGARIIFDPVFSTRCGPTQWLGSKRFTPAPCAVEDIPEVDAIVISHNHYDHMDTNTIRTLFRRRHCSHKKSESDSDTPTQLPHIFAPLGNAEYFKSIGVPEAHTHILDWWDTNRVEVMIPSISEGKEDKKAELEKVVFDVTCTPCQHGTGRGLLDRFKTLWASFVVEEIVPESFWNISRGAKVYFAGDTGYRAIQDGQNEEEAPVCPAFREIGEKWNGFDLALIPIGAYAPRLYMSPIHCAPQDSVRIFQDVKAKKAVGMHWGTWVLTTEDVTEPPRLLAEECKKAGIKDVDFGVCDIGETLFF